MFGFSLASLPLGYLHVNGPILHTNGRCLHVIWGNFHTNVYNMQETINPAVLTIFSSGSLASSSSFPHAFDASAFLLSFT